MQNSRSIPPVGANISTDPVVVINEILNSAVRSNASDIHIEPGRNQIRVRYRVDGCMVHAKDIPLAIKDQLVARVKVLAKLDTAERRNPQDGHLKTMIGGAEVDFRVSVLPMVHGESVVLRVMKQDAMTLSISDLGMSPAQEQIFRKGILAPNGMVLVTGPTGSGKTTTLYTGLAELNKSDVKLATVEDPVEFNLEGVCQTQVNKETGLDFAMVLRALLRQDPDVILLGEIRDQETAVVAIQAAMTGHLVLSTLHTNDAPSTVLRLTNMQVDPFLVVAAVNTVVSQRLLRKLCAECRYSVKITPEELRVCGLSAEKYGHLMTYRGRGCEACNGSGFKGRAAVYEVLDFNEGLKELVLRGESAIALRKAAIQSGMEPLRNAALRRALEGVTTLAEAVASCL